MGGTNLLLTPRRIPNLRFCPEGPGFPNFLAFCALNSSLAVLNGFVFGASSDLVLVNAWLLLDVWGAKLLAMVLCFTAGTSCLPLRTDSRKFLTSLSVKVSDLGQTKLPLQGSGFSIDFTSTFDKLLLRATGVWTPHSSRIFFTRSLYKKVLFVGSPSKMS